MPSRPMQMGDARRVSFSASIDGAMVHLDVSQKAGARTASGSVRIDDPQQPMHATARTWGVLQRADGWASVTGVLEVGNGRTEAATIVIDQRNPLAADHGASISIALDGGYRVSGTVAPREVKFTK